ncbi:MAG: hypothetical protein WBM32_12850 [Crocosphaera sp.]
MNLLDLIFKFNDQIITLWNFYVVSIIVLVGWKIEHGNNLSISQNVIIVITFIGFMFFNITALISSYTALSKLVTELESVNVGTLGLSEKTLKALIQRFKPFKAKLNNSIYTWYIGIAFHFFVDFFVIYIILCPKVK